MVGNGFRLDPISASCESRATQQQLCDALGAAKELNQVYRRLVKMALEELQLIEQQMDQLDHDRGSAEPT